MADRPAGNPIIEAAGLRAGQSVLDIGFRRIAVLQSFAEIVGDQGVVTGVDISPTHVAAAQAVIRESASANIRVLEASILELPFRDETFNVILCLGVLHEVRDLDRAFREVFRILRPDGCVVIADFQRFSRFKFALYRAQIRLRGETCLDVHPGFAHQGLATCLKRRGLCEISYQTLPGKWRMGFIRSGRFLLVADKSTQ